jgi:hypothetical protein
MKTDRGTESQMAKGKSQKAKGKGPRSLVLAHNLDSVHSTMRRVVYDSTRTVLWRFLPLAFALCLCNLGVRFTRARRARCFGSAPLLAAQKSLPAKTPKGFSWLLLLPFAFCHLTFDLSFCPEQGCL